MSNVNDWQDVQEKPESNTTGNSTTAINHVPGAISSPREPFVFASCNLKYSAARLAKLIHHAESMSQPFHVICVQDPPRELPFRPRGPYYLWYEAIREVTEQDNPNIYPVVVPPAMQKRVAFFVLKTIELTDWDVTTYGTNSDLVATLRLKTPPGEIVAFHNVYNRNNTLNIDQLFDKICSGPKAQFPVGDFNLHHPSWAGENMTGRAEPKAEQLYDAVAAANMELLSTRGAITYSRSARPDQYCSTIDLVFGSLEVSSWNPRWSVLDVPGFHSDHRVTQTTLDIEPNLVARTRLDWRRANGPEVRRSVGEALQWLDGNIALPTTSAVDRYATKLADLLYAATASSVPLTKPRAPLLNPMNVTYGEIVGAGDMSPAAVRAQLAKHDKAVMQFKRRRWRVFVHQGSRRRHGIHHMARVSQRISQPAADPHLNSLLDANGVPHTDTPTLCRIYKDHLWTYTDDHLATHIPRPRAAPQREEHACPQELRDGEVEKLINKLKRGKAAGHDKVANEILRLAKDIILPYLEHLFKACIALSHEPSSFKIAKTIILRKPEKKSYAKPNAWRPIALLSSLGKMLEAIIAQRLRELAAQHNLLPAAEFGGTGKCTTKALRKLMDPVYSAWCRDLCATLLSLDIKGAYDRVDRGKLLEILIGKRIPDWIIGFVWSFLSSRSTTLDMPGHPTQGPFFVNIGIPQGSTLSPILFHFFTAPMLDRLSPTTDRNPDKVALAYVDDTYLLAVSPDREQNCRILKSLHDDWIMNWAGESGVTFEPDKYAVMHFQKPWSRHECDLLPNIAGLTKNALKTEMRILGVIVDNRLTWQGHVEHIKSKVRKVKSRLRCISAPTWGLSLLKMRQLYLCKVRPIISYGCAVWFIRGQDVRWKFSRSLMLQLESKQYGCLVQVAGAFKGIPHEYLLKELYVEPLEIFLERCALTHVARNLAASPETRSKILEDSASPQKSSHRTLQSHPYHVLERQSQQLRERAQERLARRDAALRPHKNLPLKASQDPKDVAKAINACAREDAEIRAEQFWRKWRTERQAHTSKDQPALWDIWGKETLRYYENLPRAQSSLLLQCRTGVGGLGTHLFRVKVADSDKCDCGEQQTAEHLFLKCTKLGKARSLLFQRLGRTTFRQLMREHTATAADWAICFFGLSQFDWTKSNLINTFTRDMLRISS